LLPQYSPPANLLAADKSIEARKVYLRAFWLAVLTLFSGVTAQAAEPIDGFEDNGFLVEEAYNQDRGEALRSLSVPLRRAQTF
jgi:hypothetical protein